MSLRALCSLAWGALTAGLAPDDRAALATEVDEPLPSWWSERPAYERPAPVADGPVRVVNLWAVPA